MNKPKVYLAGPIAGKTFGEAASWRNHLEQSFGYDFDFLTPLRGKDTFFDKNEVIGQAPYDHQQLTSSKGVTRRDFWDCTRADAVLCNLLGATKVSIGTVMECAWAYQARVPLIIVMEKGNVHQHIMLNESATYVVETLEEGVQLLRWLFS